MNDLKIGLIGCGKQAPKHVSGLRQVPGVKLILADIDPEKARQLGTQSGLPWVSDPEEIFADPTVQAVDICTPTSSHVELIRRAAKAKKDFLCEKPLCEDVDEARAIEDLIEKNGLMGMVGYIYRFAPICQFGQTLFEEVPATGVSKALGRVVSAFLRIGGRGSHQVWKHRKATGGGAVNEMLVHMLDLAIWYFGPVKEAQTLVSKLLRPRRVIQGREETVDAEDYVVVRLEMESGVEVLCQADLVTPAFTHLMEVQGENGTFLGSVQPERPSFVYCHQAAAGYPEGKTELSFGRRNFFEAQMAEFVSAVRSGRPVSGGTVRDSILLLEALEKTRNR